MDVDLVERFSMTIQSLHLVLNQSLIFKTEDNVALASPPSFSSSNVGPSWNSVGCDFFLTSFRRSTPGASTSS